MASTPLPPTTPTASQRAPTPQGDPRAHEHQEPQEPYVLDLTDTACLATLGRRHQAVAHDPWYTLSDAKLCTPVDHPFPTQVADLLDVCAQITLLDRICPRPRQMRRAQYGLWRGWARQFTVTLGVREPDRWNAPQVRSALEQLLTWMTQDAWKLTFRYAERRTIVSVRQAELIMPSPDARVVLFSGGLDSLAGAVSLLETTPNDLILVGVTHDRLQPIVLRQMGELHRHYGSARVHRGHIPFELTRMPKRDDFLQRTRAFRFLACAAAQAVACGVTDLVVCENGVGSLNLPYNWRLLGAQLTRATHPTTLLQMTAVLRALEIGPLHCVAPFQFQTKGEICRQLTVAGLGPLSAKTVSCDSFPFHERAPQQGEELHCGECTSCLLRRQALYASGLAMAEAPGKYRYDMCLPPDLLHPERIHPLKMMLDQVTTIERCAREQGGTHATLTTLATLRSAFLREFPELGSAATTIAQDPTAFGLSASATTEEIIAGLCGLLERYAEEWRQVPYRVEAA